MVAISPQTPEHNAEVRRKWRLPFRVLTDAGNAYARQLGIVHGFPEDLRQVYRDFDLPLPRFNGDESWELPLPTRVVVDADGVLRAVDADPDYTRRPEAEASLAVLRSLA